MKRERHRAERQSSHEEPKPASRRASSLLAGWLAFLPGRMSCQPPTEGGDMARFHSNTHTQRGFPPPTAAGAVSVTFRVHSARAPAATDRTQAFTHAHVLFVRSIARPVQDGTDFHHMHHTGRQPGRQPGSQAGMEADSPGPGDDDAPPNAGGAAGGARSGVGPSPAPRPPPPSPRDSSSTRTPPPAPAGTVSEEELARDPVLLRVALVRAPECVHRIDRAD